MKKEAKGRFWLALTVFSLAGQVAWVVENMYFNVFIYNMFRATAADIAAMVAASAVTATLTTVLIGALSDKLGRRKLFICGGYILWGISIFTFVFLRTELLSPLAASAAAAASLGVTLAIVLDCVMTFFGQRCRLQRLAHRRRRREEPRPCRGHQRHDAACVHSGGLRRLYVP